MMAQWQDLAEHLDFSPGLSFQKEVCQHFGKSVHHPSSSPDGSSFLLATFRRYTFQLSEDSVALALQSCLGGTASSFHVQYQSDRHYRFSVSCKAVGFHVYNLWRFIRSCFDVYFHLWHNGTPNWEREKRLWEEKQASEWIKVMSKKSKRDLRRANNVIPKKKVRFADCLDKISPAKKSALDTSTNFLKFGSLPPVNLDASQFKVGDPT